MEVRTEDDLAGHAVDGTVVVAAAVLLFFLVFFTWVVAAVINRTHTVCHSVRRVQERHRRPDQPWPST